MSIVLAEIVSSTKPVLYALVKVCLSPFRRQFSSLPRTPSLVSNSFWLAQRLSRFSSALGT